MIRLPVLWCTSTQAATTQVVIARVISFDRDNRRLRLSLALKSGNSEAAGDPVAALQLGDLVEGVVVSVASKEVTSRAHVASHSTICPCTASSCCPESVMGGPLVFQCRPRSAQISLTIFLAMHGNGRCL